MKKTVIEERIAKLLMGMYPENEYKALIVATAIIDVLIAEDAINLDQSKMDTDDSSEIK